MNLVYFQDPGHGWLRVSRRDAHTILGESFSQITPFSHQKGQWIYLEEDQDAGLLIKALQDQGLSAQAIDALIEQKHTNNRSTIRSYTPFQA